MMAVLLSIKRCLCASMVALPVLCAAQASTSPAPPEKVRQEWAASLTAQSLRDFNADDFLLAYDVLLGAGDLHRAFLVAQRAVQARPSDHQWRRKLAQVSEWTQRPEVAAQQWMAMFSQGDHSLDTLRAVIRLAPQSDQPLLALQAWGELSKHQVLTAPQWQDIFNLYEMAAQPSQGSQFFEDRFALTPEPILLEFAARLAESAGDDARAQRLYVQRTRLEPFSLDITLRAAVMLVRSDKMQDALDLLKLHQHQVSPQAQVYWQLLRQVAWDAGDMATARAAYSQFAADRASTVEDWSRLVFLVRQTHPAQAADLALQAYKRFNSVDQLMLGLGIYVELNDAAALKRVYAGLDVKQNAALEKNARFLMMRAQFYRGQKKPDLALTDFLRALRLDPNDASVVLEGLWLLIDEHRVDLLPDFLRDHSGKAATEPMFWAAYGAANQTLDRHRDALRWYAKAVKRDPQDALLLLNYADVLERTGQTGMADRMRRHAWLLLQKKFPSGSLQQSPAQSAEMLAFARLSLLNQAGDPGMALVRQWVAQLRGLPDAVASEQSSILVLGWAVLKEQYVNARSWMWQRYARQVPTAPPLWADSQTALQLHETMTLGQLLSDHQQAMPIYNRYDTAYVLGHVQQAVDIAFKGMSQQEDEALHDRYRQHVPGQSNYVQLGWKVAHQGGLDSHGLQFETRLMVHPKMELILRGERSQQSVSDPVMQPEAPSTDRLLDLQLNWHGSHGTTSLAVAGHDELNSLTRVRLLQSFQLDSRLNLEAGLNVRDESSVSSPMQLAGYENSVHAGMTYALGKREYLRIAPRAARYYTQFGLDLGSSSFLDLEFGYRVRTEYPDWRLRAYLTRQTYSLNENFPVDWLRYFIPESSTNLGGCWSMGENLAGQSLREGYSRAWRPFFDMCFNHNSLNGAGLNGSLGVVGAVTGEDHLLIELRGSDGTQTNNSSTNALVVRYRRYF